MEKSNIENYILKLLQSNKNGVGIDIIIDYLDYVNKVRYTEEEVFKILKSLVEQNKISQKDNIYYFIK